MKRLHAITMPHLVDLAELGSAVDSIAEALLNRQKYRIALKAEEQFPIAMDDGMLLAIKHLGRNVDESSWQVRKAVAEAYMAQREKGEEE